MTPSANDLYRAAQDYIRDDQPVFLCRAKGKTAKAPLTKHGLHDATLDSQIIKRQLRHFGTNAALAIPTGIQWDVLDVDIHGEIDGRVHLPYLQQVGLLNGCKRVVKTPSGGWHLYFKAAPQLTNKARAMLGLDVRAKGGYVLAPPSYIETEDYEGAYTDIGPTTGSSDEPLLWDLVASAVRPINKTTNKEVLLLPSDRQTSLAALREWVSIRQPGERNNALHWAVCRCIDNGLDPHELMEPALLTGLGEEEILLTINSALRRAGVTADELETEAEALFPESEE